MSRAWRVPDWVIEILRLFVVVFFAGLGYYIANGMSSDDVRLGPLDGVTLGVLLGAGIGYVSGGVIARLTIRTVGTAEQALSSRSTEQVLGGVLGAGLGVLSAAAVMWPVLLIGSQIVVLPLFGFVVVSIGLLGYRIGVARRHDVLGLLGAHPGMGSSGAGTSRERLLDTSVAIDGRIVDVVAAGFLHGTFVVPQPVLDELQGLADATDPTRRVRGRRGLEALNALRGHRSVDVEVIPDLAREISEVDAKLVRMCSLRGCPLLTVDANLAKVASVTGVPVLNLHALAIALRPPVVVGDVVRVGLLKPGREPGQAVGYLDDGTMVVAERCRDQIGQDASVVITSVLTTANGRMVFARPQS
ncbi:MAG: PIN/TRAM domain-containing protein [Actinomycetota bacterium]